MEMFEQMHKPKSQWVTLSEKSHKAYRDRPIESCKIDWDWLRHITCLMLERSKGASLGCVGWTMQRWSGMLWNGMLHRLTTETLGTCHVTWPGTTTTTWVKSKIILTQYSMQLPCSFLHCIALHIVYWECTYIYYHIQVYYHIPVDFPLCTFPDSMKYFCNCEKYCESRQQEVHQSTYHQHVPY